ncbi:MAG TPA: hypothetical protein ENI11_04715 [Actinobacteria bacterium]|nr:hypothetical protein [Actinomycetota bacterium]
MTKTKAIRFTRIRPDCVRLVTVEDEVILVPEGNRGEYEPLKRAHAIYRQLAAIGGTSPINTKRMIEFIERYGLLGGDTTVSEAILAKATGIEMTDESTEGFRAPVLFSFALDYPDYGFNDQAESLSYEIEVAREFYALVSLHNAITSAPVDRPKKLKKLLHTKGLDDQNRPNIYFMNMILPPLVREAMKENVMPRGMAIYLLKWRINSWLGNSSQIAPTIKTKDGRFTKGPWQPSRLIDALYLRLYQDITSGYMPRQCIYCEKSFVPDRGNRVFCLPQEGQKESECSVSYRRRKTYLNQKVRKTELRDSIKSTEHKKAVEELETWKAKKTQSEQKGAGE